MCSSNHTYIGVWFNYTDHPTLSGVSTFDYEALRKVPFEQFYMMADSMNYVDPTSYFNYNYDIKTWTVSKQTSTGENQTNYIEFSLQVDSLKMDSVEVIGIH